MSERRMAALVGEGDQQHTESPGRRTRISRAHLTGSLHGHQSTENPILLVSFISRVAKHYTDQVLQNLLAKEKNKKVKYLTQLNFAFPAPREQIHDEFADGCAFSLGETTQLWIQVF